MHAPAAGDAGRSDTGMDVADAGDAADAGSPERPASYQGASPGGAFTFHVHNAGATTLLVDIGWRAPSITPARVRPARAALAPAPSPAPQRQTSKAPSPPAPSTSSARRVRARTPAGNIDDVATRAQSDRLPFQANIDSIVQRSICGHATQEMSELYSTVGQKEIQRAVGKVISMVGYRELTLGGEAEYARSMQAGNGPSEGPDEALDEATTQTLTP